MANAPHQTKRVQVDKTQAIMLGIVIGASIITMFGLVASKSFFSQASYLGKVAGEKEKAVKQLKANKDAVGKLTESYKSFAAQNPNLIGGNSTGSGERDGDNGRLVLDALPSKYDFPALATSLEKLLSGYAINSVTGTDDIAAQATDTKSQPVDMPFKLDVSSDYAGMVKLTQTFEKSIRPFQVEKLELAGTNSKLQATITAKTFYQPEKDLKIETKVIK
jgi:hypothetical protein